eukprot:TRINITY_DN1296_c2_g1_i1.p1 TRINITY_DN1296_c2_g1~~TRINITY_DN1296_c2_g1_i1.p1  ORF type:complete len:955 (-),score=151.91 TRINITY_DN1296_c2_g1_i1:65-2929(-)
MLRRRSWVVDLCWYTGLWLAVFIVALGWHEDGNIGVRTVSAQLFSGVVPQNDSCLYLSNTNTRVLILQSTYYNNTKVDLIMPNASVINSFTDSGLLPSGIAVSNNVAYVSSYQTVNYYDVSNNMKLMGTFVDFVRLYNAMGITCQPAHIIAHDAVLYVSCSPGSPYTILKFSIAPDDTYATFLNGTLPLLSSYSFTKMLIREGTFQLGGKIRPTGMYLFAIAAPSSVISISLIDSTPQDGLGNSGAWTFARVGANPRDSPEAGLSGSETWSGMTFGGDQDFYMIRRYLPTDFNASAVPPGKDGYLGDILRFDGQSGAFKQVITGKSTGKLAKAVAMSLGPLGYFYVSIVSQFYFNAKVAIYNPVDGTRLDNYITGSTENELVPQDMQWYPCINYTTDVVPSNTLLSTDTGNERNTLVIVLATVLPGAGIWLCCILLLLLLLFPAMKLRDAWAKRRRTYEVGDSDGIVGKNGNQNFTFREIDPVDLAFGPFLGEGAFGKVYKGTWREAVVAIKTFDVSLDDADEDMMQEIRREAQMMDKLGNHPNVLGFLGAVTRPGNGAKLCIVTEFCAHGSLHDFLIKKKRRLPNVFLIKMARDIASGILHLHREKIIHRDIATRNVLVFENLNVCIADFGLARILESENAVQKTQTNMGPVRWMAPECMLAREYSEASDAFAYGVTLWEMVTRKAPWRGLEAPQVIIAVTQKNTRLQLPIDCDPIIARIIRAVWKTNPSKRMKMSEIVAKLELYHDSLNEAYEISTDSEDETGSSERDERSDLVSKKDPPVRRASHNAHKSFIMGLKIAPLKLDQAKPAMVAYAEADVETGIISPHSTRVQFMVPPPMYEKDEDSANSSLYLTDSEDEDSSKEDDNSSSSSSSSSGSSEATATTATQQCRYEGTGTPTEPMSPRAPSDSDSDSDSEGGAAASRQSKGKERAAVRRSTNESGSSGMSRSNNAI